ncbi:MAG: hypothetical protein HKO98_16090 [Gemmatimonadetes bacterium]|nr:hypothetical protein [Gemmatimonadota bacterium]
MAARDRDVARASAACAALAVLLFLPSLRGGFAYDDVQIIVENPAFEGWSALLASLVEPYWPGPDGTAFGLWRPLTTLALGIQRLLFGDAAWAFHAVNVALHGVVTALVVRVGAGFLPLAVAVGAGIIFAVHPVHTEAVANVVGFAELGAAAAFLLAVGSFARDGVTADGPRPLTPARVAVVCTLYLVACLTKESAIVLPALLVVLEAWRLRLGVRDVGGLVSRRAGLYAGLAACAVAVIVGRYLVLDGATTPTPALGAALLVDIPRIHTLGEIWWQYGRLLSMPLWLSPDYTPGVIAVTTVWTPRALVGVAGVLAVLAGAWWSVRRSEARPSLVAFAVAWFAVTILPVANVVFVTGVLVAERTLYLPSVAVAWAMGAAGVWLWRRSVPMRALPVVAVLVWATTVLLHVPLWRDTASVFRHMVQTVPESGRSQWVLADELLAAGRTEDAVDAYALALSRLGGEIPFLTRSAGRLHQAGVVGPARALALRAWAADSLHASAPQLLTVIAAGDEDWDEVATWSRATLTLLPDDPVSLHLLSAAEGERENWRAARDARERLVRGAPGEAWQQWMWLIELRGRTGDPEGARAAADSARRRSPSPEGLRQIDSLTVVFGGKAAPLQNPSNLQIPTLDGRQR